MTKAHDKSKTAKEIYHERKAAGLCVDCGKRQAKKNRVQCGPCIKATAERAARRAKKVA
jgi:hypothetical protein